MTLLNLPPDRRSRLLVVLAWMAGGGILASCWIVAAPGSHALGDRAAIFGVFTAILIFLEIRPMSTQLSTRMMTFSWTIGFTLILIVPVQFALSALAAAAAVGWCVSIKQKRPAEVATGFEASSTMMSLFAAEYVGSRVVDLQSVATGASPDLRWLVAVLLAQITGVMLSAVIEGFVTSFGSQQSIARTVIVRADEQLRTDGLFFGLSPVFAVVATTSVILLPILLYTMWIVLHSTSQAMASQHAAAVDELTGIANRRMFDVRGARMLEGVAARSGQAAVIHLDLDGFKGINDRLGHQYGDGVLKQVAERLESSKRSVDMVARLGGDEFAIVLGSVSGRADAELAANRVLAKIMEPLEVAGVPLSVSASLGVALFPDDGETLTTVLHHADLAMYRAKTDLAGVSMYAANSSTAPGRLSLLSELRDAINNEDLRLHYQPKVNIETGTIQRVEALLRWNHPEHGEVSPGWFMPMAEQTDLMRDVTDFVLRSALTQCASWRAAGIEVGVAVNASARNLHDFRFPHRIRNFLSEVSLDGSCLELEITENTIMEDPRRSAAVLEELRSLGVSVSIDDFGTGYSSLASLRNLTIDSIKIDRSFVLGLADSDADLTIVKSVVELGRSLGLSTVAEGVETDEVLQIVKDLGVDEFQGYLASRPLAAVDIEPILRHGFFDMSTYEVPPGENVVPFTRSNGRAATN